MKYLFVKMSRDLAKMWTQFLSVFLMAFFGILIYVGTEGTWFGMQTEMNDYFQKSNLASSWIYGNGLTKSDIKKISKVQGVTDSELATILSSKVKLPGTVSGKEPDLRIISSCVNKISKPLTVSGAEFSQDSTGIYIDDDFAKANGIKVGDKLTISVGNVTKSLAVRGTALSSEYVYYNGSGTEAMPNHQKHGYAFIGSNTAKDIFNETVALKMQDGFVPELQNKIDTIYKTAKDKADEQTRLEFNKKVSSQKSTAYKEAISIADKKTEAVFNSALAEKKQAAYNSAVKTADEKVTKLVNQKYEASMPGKDYTKLPEYDTTLSTEKTKAEKQAKEAVDEQFATQKTTLDAQLASAKTEAEKKAKEAVDNKFSSMQPQFSTQLDTAIKKAEGIAEQKAETQICKTLNISESEFGTLQSLLSMPKISTLNADKRAEKSEEFITLLKGLPDSMLSQNVNGFSISTIKNEPLNYNIIRLKTASGTDSKAIEDKVQDILDDRYAGFADRNSMKSVSAPIQKTRQIEKMSIMFSTIFVMLALLTMQTAMARLVDTQRTQIGTLKALGFKDRQIRLHYAAYGISVGLFGGLLGLVIAPVTIAPALLYSQSTIYTLPEWHVRLTPASFIMVLVVVLCCMVATLCACRKGLVWMPAETMRGATPKAGRKVMLERMPGLWKRVSFGWKWTIRDIARSKIRSLMGIVGVLGCMMLLIASFGMQYSDDSAPGYIYKRQYQYGAKAVLLSSSTQENRDELYKITGGGQWVEETSVEYNDTTIHENGTLSVIGDGQYVFLQDAEGAVLNLPSSGVLITQRTAKLLNLKKGDNIRFRLFGERSYISATVRGIAVTPLPQGIFVSKTAWEKLGKTFTPTALMIKGTKDVGKIGGLSYVTEVTTLKNQYQSAFKSANTFNFIFLLLKVAAILLNVVILYNLGILSFTERIREYATLKVIGFYQREIRSFALRESLATTLTGWLIGIPVGLCFLKAYVGAVSSSTMDLIPQLTAVDFALATLITVGCSILVSLFLSHKVKKIDMVGALKSVE